MRLTFLLPALLGLASLGTSQPARAATPSEYCTGYVTSLPATISAQGTWCLSGDLATSLSTGPAITLANNNITLDCNGYKIGGLGAGPTSSAIGVYAASRLNLTLRDCSVRGFRIGLWLSASAIGGGHLVEGNRFDGQLSAAIVVAGEGNVVRRNQVNDVGSNATDQNSFGILAGGSLDVIDNTIDGVLVGTGHFAYGVYITDGTGVSIRGNRLRGLGGGGAGVPFGVYLEDTGPTVIRDNDVFGPGAVGVGISCNSTQSVAANNFVGGMATEVAGCTNYGNLLPP